jgi:hypothetical protein
VDDRDTMKAEMLRRIEEERGATIDQISHALTRGAITWTIFGVLAYFGLWWVFLVVAAIFITLLLWLSSKR